MLKELLWEKAPYAEVINRKDRGEDGEKIDICDDNYNYLLEEEWMN